MATCNPDSLGVKFYNHDDVQIKSQELAKGYCPAWGGALEMHLFCQIWNVSLAIYQLPVLLEAYTRAGSLKRIWLHTPVPKSRGNVLIIHSGGDYFDGLDRYPVG